MESGEDRQTEGPQTRSRTTSPRHRRRRHRSSDIILIDSNTPRRSPPRRRLRLEGGVYIDSTFIDLTCEVVDLTTPSPEADTVIEVGLDDDADQPANDQAEPSNEHNASQESNAQPTLYCPICLEKYSKIVKDGGQLKSTICGHVFCASCIQVVLFHSKKCPTCRKKLDSRKVHNLYLPL